MTQSNRKNHFRALSGAALALAVFVGAAPAVAADAGTASSACRQEVRRVAVWPQAPKATQMARFENREVTVCNGKVVSQKPQRNASNAEAGIR